MAVKPFFYYEDAHFFAFASEIKGILCLNGIDDTINKQFFYNQLIWLTEQTDDITLYEKINRLKPAHSLTVYNGTSKRTQRRQYWDLDTKKEINSSRKEDYYEGLAFHFEQAVQCRARTAYPIGAELSGGLDSSAITGAAQTFLKQNGQHIITFSNTLPTGATNEKLLQVDERRFMDDVIRFNDIHDYVFVTKKAFDNIIEGIDFSLTVDDGLEYYNSRWQVPGRIAAAQKEVRTMLSGFPGDQMVTSLNKTYFLDLFHKKQYLEYFRAKQRFQPRFNKLRPLVPANLVSALLKLKSGFGFYDDKIKAAAAIYHIPADHQKRINAYLHKRTRNQFFKSYR
ncbi:MAG: asparagine synthase-related protein, partial [Candidatus Saccharimonadales bacterium]